MLLHSFAMLVSLQFWSLHVKTLHVGGHAGVGVVSLHGALPSLPLIVTPFAEFFRLGRAMRDELPLGNGGVARIFVIAIPPEINSNDFGFF